MWSISEGPDCTSGRDPGYRVAYSSLIVVYARVWICRVLTWEVAIWGVVRVGWSGLLGVW